jgi:hypothetical protein
LISQSPYTAQHNTETQRQTFMPRAAFEPTIPETERQSESPSYRVVTWQHSILFTNLLFQCSGYGQKRFGHYVAIISGNSSQWYKNIPLNAAATDDCNLVAETRLAISRVL